MTITIGPGAIDRENALSATSIKTVIDVTEPADGTGTLSTFEVFLNEAATAAKMGTFTQSGSDFTPRDYESLGAVSAGSKQTFSGLDCDVASGDYLGLYLADGKFEYDGTASTTGYSYTGDGFQGTYTYTSRCIIVSIYGESGSSGWTGKILGVTNPAKIMGIDVANIAKVGGV